MVLHVHSLPGRAEPLSLCLGPVSPPVVCFNRMNKEQKHGLGFSTPGDIRLLVQVGAASPVL